MSSCEPTEDNSASSYEASEANALSSYGTKEDDAATIKITVNTLDAKSEDFDIPDSRSLNTLKDLVEARVGVPKELIVLLDGASRLSGNPSLKEIGLQDGAKLTLIKRRPDCGLNVQNATGPIVIAEGENFSRILRAGDTDFCSMSWEMWLKTDDWKKVNSMQRLEILQQDSGFGIKLEYGHVVAYRWGGSEQRVPLQLMENPSVWCKLLVVFKSDVAKIYQNGVLLGATRQSGVSTPKASPLTIMAPFGQFNCNAREAFPGLFSNVRLWCRELSAEDAVDLSIGETEAAALAEDASIFVDVRGQEFAAAGSLLVDVERRRLSWSF